MKKLIVKIYEGITALLFFIITIGGASIGYGMPVYYANDQAKHMLIGLVIGFFLAVVVTGAIYTLLSMNNYLKQIRDSLAITNE